MSLPSPQRAQLLRFACVSCKARRNEPCMDYRGDTVPSTQHFHASRYVAAGLPISSVGRTFSVTSAEREYLVALLRKQRQTAKSGALITSMLRKLTT